MEEHARERAAVLQAENDDLEEEDDGGSQRGQEWLLGFVEPVASTSDLLRHRFPSKVGGRPAWLDPRYIPTPQQLVCGTTMLDFLLQVYAPVEEPTGEAFHRTVFLFVSPQGDGLAAPGAVRAFRCQLPHLNPYYGTEPAPAEQHAPVPLPPADAAAVLSRDPWGVLEAERAPPTSTSAPAAPLFLPPGVAAAAAHGNGGLDLSNLNLGGGGGGGGGSSIAGPVALLSGVRLYNELELLVEPEEHEGDTDDEAGGGGGGGGGGAGPSSRPAGGDGGDMDMGDGGGDGRSGARIDVPRLLREYQARVQAEGEYADEELQDVEGIADTSLRHFAAFQVVMAKAPEQVLRYCFSAGAAPLCPSASPAPPAAADVPPCSRCGAPRRFEFQVMPQLLNYLSLEVEDPQALDWGTIAVYSCGASCAVNVGGGAAAAAAERAGCSPVYAEEFVWVQPSQ